MRQHVDAKELGDMQFCLLRIPVGNVPRNYDNIMILDTRKSISALHVVRAKIGESVLMF